MIFGGIDSRKPGLSFFLVSNTVPIACGPNVSLATAKLASHAGAGDAGRLVAGEPPAP
jgi:hypothetical protein